MSDPIIYIISAIATETIKDASKHLGKKAKEIYDTLREPIIQLDINNYSDSQEIRQKLEENPEIETEIKSKIAANQDLFDELLPVLKESFKAHSKSNKNNAKLNFSKIKGSTITTNIHQNNERVGIYYVLIIIAIVAIVAIVGIIFAFKQNDKQSNTLNANTNLNVSARNNVIPTQQIPTPPLINPTSPDNQKKQVDGALQVQLDKLEAIRVDGNKTVKNISDKIELEDCISKFNAWKQSSLMILKQIDERLEVYGKTTDYAGRFDSITNTLVSDDLIRLRDDHIKYNIKYSPNKFLDLCKSGFRTSVDSLPYSDDILRQANIY